MDLDTVRPYTATVEAEFSATNHSATTEESPAQAAEEALTTVIQRQLNGLITTRPAAQIARAPECAARIRAGLNRGTAPAGLGDWSP